MSISLWQKLDYLVRSSAPFVLSLVLVVLSVIPTHIPVYMEVAPILPLVAIYHWAIYRPNLLPVFAVFILGLLQDILVGTPVGLYTLVFLTVYGLVTSQRRFFAGKSFVFYWLGFAIISIIHLLFEVLFFHHLIVQRQKHPYILLISLLLNEH